LAMLSEIALSHWRFTSSPEPAIPIAFILIS
jgi:hypothetical protein